MVWSVYFSISLERGEHAILRERTFPMILLPTKKWSNKTGRPPLPKFQKSLGFHHVPRAVHCREGGSRVAGTEDLSGVPSTEDETLSPSQTKYPRTY